MAQIVQSYSPSGADVHPHLIHESLDPQMSAPNDISIDSVPEYPTKTTERATYVAIGRMMRPKTDYGSFR